jgi:hypothetical protein
MYAFKDLRQYNSFEKDNLYQAYLLVAPHLRYKLTTFFYEALMNSSLPPPERYFTRTGSSSRRASPFLLHYVTL